MKIETKENNANGKPALSRIITLFFLMVILTALSGMGAFAQENKQVVQMARIVVDATQLKQYKAFLKEEIETSVRIEPGVLSLRAVAEKSDSTHIIILETYADNDAYQAHLKRPHFLKYKAAVKDMVKHLELIPVNPVVTGDKPKR